MAFHQCWKQNQFEKQDQEQQSDRESESEDEAIVVTRQEEEVDPEDEAEFEREYAKMVAESLESRKFDRKQQFDLPLPLRSKHREASSSNDNIENQAPDNTPPTSTMAFSLLTKRGNRQQVRAQSTFNALPPLVLPALFFHHGSSNRTPVDTDG